MAIIFHGKAKYFLTFINDFFRKTFFHTMKSKFSVFDKLKFFKFSVENQTRKNIKAIKCDGGGEYNSKNFNAFCKENGIVKYITTPYTQEQNGVTKRKDQTFVESVMYVATYEVRS
jgi:hypothetical protein